MPVGFGERDEEVEQVLHFWEVDLRFIFDRHGLIALLGPAALLILLSDLRLNCLAVHSTQLLESVKEAFEVIAKFFPKPLIIGPVEPFALYRVLVGVQEAVEDVACAPVNKQEVEWRHHEQDAVAEVSFGVVCVGYHVAEQVECVGLVDVDEEADDDEVGEDYRCNRPSKATGFPREVVDGRYLGVLHESGTRITLRQVGVVAGQ